MKEQLPDTFVGAAVNSLRQPIRNLRRLRHLTKFSENGENPDDVIWALNDVSFEVQRSEVVGIIGSNGAGKSTLLKILSRITHPTSGRVTLKGRVSSLLEVGTGFHPELTGRENIYLNGTILGMTKAEVDRKFGEIVDFSGVEKFIDTPVKRYSSGMRVRLAFSVAAHLEPEILLVDEVLAVGDIAFQQKCLGKMRDVTQKGRTVLFVSHNMNAIENLCSRTLLLDEGRIIAQGNSEQVIDRYLEISKPSKLVRGLESNLDFKFDMEPSKKMQIRRVRVLDGNENPLSRLDNRTSFTTEIAFDVREYEEGAYLIWLLRGADDKVICYSTDRDESSKEVIFNREGSYVAQVVFPGNLLNEGNYRVQLIITDHMRTQAHDHQEFGLKVLNRQSFGLDRGARGVRKGSLLIPLSWRVNQS